MKRLLRYITYFSLLSLLTVAAAGCQEKKAECPFTTVTWGNTLEDITELEGECSDTYDSIYDGTTYAYPKEYNGLDGTVKYAFDDKEKLVSMSWLYETEDSEDLTEVYDKLHGEAEAMLGESGFQYNSDKFSDLTSPGDVWYLKDGNVIITTVDTNEAKLLQYTFLHPDVSEEKPQKN